MQRKLPSWTVEWKIEGKRARGVILYLDCASLNRHYNWTATRALRTLNPKPPGHDGLLVERVLPGGAVEATQLCFELPLVVT